MGVTPDPTFIADVLRRLIQINSVNPHLDASAPGEVEIVTYLDAVLSGLGIPTRIFEFAPHRPSIVGTLAGAGGGKSLMLNAHIDTVATDGMADPFGATVHDGKMYGRGSYDMKSAMAACIGAAKALKDAAKGEDADFDVSLKTFFVCEPFEVARGAAIVRALDVATERRLGEVAAHIGDAPWMDAALLSAAGVETVVFGPSGAGAHASEEWVDIDSVIAVAGVLAEAAIDYCGTA